MGATHLNVVVAVAVLLLLRIFEHRLVALDVGQANCCQQRFHQQSSPERIGFLAQGWFSNQFIDMSFSADRTGVFASSVLTPLALV